MPRLSENSFQTDDVNNISHCGVINQKYLELNYHKLYGIGSI
jgi:hypothetical protein